MDNQTDERWLVGITQSTKGTGIFAFPDHLSGEFSGEIWSEYLDCVQRGTRDWIIAFKWIPLTVASRDEVIASAASCGTVLCVKRCAGYGCACIGGECK